MVSTCDPTARPSISLILVVRDSVGALPELLDDILAQDLPRTDWEVVAVDGNSRDGTPDLLERTLGAALGLQWRLFANPRLALAPGWNIGLAAARGEAMVRVDAHARIGPTFLRRCVEALASGEDIVGGPVLTLPPQGRLSLLYAVENSRFAGAAAGFRRAGPPRYVDTLAYAAYRRRVFEVCGGLDERLHRNQDNELHARLRHAGFRFRCDPSITSRYRMRATWRGVLGQKFRNGYWVALTSAVRPGCFAARHLAPVFFVTALAIGTALGVLRQSWLALSTVLLLYAVVAIAITAREVSLMSVRPKAVLVALPIACCIVHLVYGIGTLSGTFAVPGFMFRHRNYQLPRPVTRGVA
ncbi:MAG: glycosyltransferase [Candidatus Krumholzibacteria bacterium]|jgi:glycosyltransferase involved in cell wall biosynthesis|nr:glycosyltransferase [Candidatus Krumholzibacteria bacterium]